MFKETCLVDPRRTAGTPRKLGIEGPRTTVPVQCYLPWSKHMQSINKMQQTCVIWMHRKKEEVILRILAQESLDLELWLKRYEFLKFWSYFWGFSEARDLFVNIFWISDRTENFVDRGLISENRRGLSAKSAKSGPWVDFTKVQGPLCKISE
jgi:hypothetical protein